MQTENSISDKGQGFPAYPEYENYCIQAFAAAKEAGANIIRLSIAAPDAPLLAQAQGSMLWCPAQGSQNLGSGSIFHVVGTGKKRIQEIKTKAEKLWESLYEAPHANVKPQSPRLFGGLSFAPQTPKKPWDKFGQSLFWLPRTLYTKLEGSQTLSLCARVDESPKEVAQELFREQTQLLLAEQAIPTQAKIDRTEHLSEEVWTRQIQAIRKAIHAGTLTKVIAARASTLHFVDGIELRPALERLSDKYQDCYRFAFQIDGQTFLGASPETLIHKEGLQISTQAVAGSIAAKLPDADMRLLASKKDRFEQALVVQAIEEALSPFCSKLDYSKTPTTLTLRHVTHLCTPIAGKLAERKHVLDLIDALHPTPAVGGTPKQAAMDWIADTEGERGWYAGPVGWFDSTGDGNFAVAIRSALFSGNDAWVYAGAGIVADSDPILEYLETGLKQRVILDALGILS